MNTRVLVNPLLVWGLATFHTAFFVLTPVFLFYRNGALGGNVTGLNTFVGFGLFLALWLTTWWSTRGMLHSLAARRFTDARGMITILLSGAVWGAVNGALFLLCLLLGFMLNVVFASIREGRPEQALAFLLLGPVYGGIAAIVAALAGAVVGMLFGVVDGIVLLAVRARLPASPAAGVVADSHEAPSGS